MQTEKHTSRLDETIERSVRTMPEQSVPDGFSARVMAALPPRRVSVWTRLRLWLTRPRSLTFTPLTAAPALALAVVLLFLVLRPGSSTQPVRDALSPVRFVLYDARRTASSVAVIGSFNNWQPTTDMHYDPAAGAWVLEARLPQGEYEYVFMVDGKQIVPDPRAQASRNDGFGQTNSIIYVGGGNAQAL